MLDFSEYTVPLHTQEALSRYIEQGIPTGDFLYSVLSNDLFGAVDRADRQNYNCLKEIVKWIHMYAPPACYGAEAKVMRWVQDHPARQNNPETIAE